MGGRNAVELGPRLVQDGGSPMATHRSALHGANSTTDDIIDTFIQVMWLHHASHNITVRQRHVENVGGGLISQNSPTPKTNIFTTFTPDSLAEQKQNYLAASFFLSKVHLLDTNNSIYIPITPPLSFSYKSFVALI